MKRLALSVVVIAVLVAGASSAAKGPTPKVTIAQTVSNGTDNISLSGSHWPPSTTVSWLIQFCPTSGGCSAPVTGTASVDPSGNFNTGPAASEPCNNGFFTQVVANVFEPSTGAIFAHPKKLAC